MAELGKILYCISNTFIIFQWKSSFLKKKNFWSKIIFLAHSVDPNLGKIISCIVFSHCVSKHGINKMWQKFPENRQFLEKVSENLHYGSIYQKALYFLIMWGIYTQKNEPSAIRVKYLYHSGKTENFTLMVQGQISQKTKRTKNHVHDISLIHPSWMDGSMVRQALNNRMVVRSNPSVGKNEKSF
jgi:hypothetical protein